MFERNMMSGAHAVTQACHNVRSLWAATFYTCLVKTIQRAGQVKYCCRPSCTYRRAALSDCGQMASNTCTAGIHTLLAFTHEPGRKYHLCRSYSEILDMYVLSQTFDPLEQKLQDMVTRYSNIMQQSCSSESGHPYPANFRILS